MGFTKNKEEQSLIQMNKPVIYKRRWYILFIFCNLTLAVGSLWNIWGPIANSAERAFNWSNATIATLSNYGPIVFVATSFFFSWIMDNKGLRWAVLLTSLFCVIGSLLRCITCEQPHVTWLNHVGQVFISLALPVVFAAPPLLSITWFPVEERILATAIASHFSVFDISFITGPSIVPEIPLNQTNNSTDFIKTIKDRIMLLNYISSIWVGVIFILVLVYFPAKPKSAPSLAAVVERKSFREGVFQLFRLPYFWILAIPYAISSGVFNIWSSVLEINLKPLGITQIQAGWIAFLGTVVSSIFGIIIGKFADRFTKRLKMFLVILYVLATAMSLWFTLIVEELIPMNMPSLYVSVMLTTSFINGAVPLFFEALCEITHPIAEGITTVLLTQCYYISQLLFLLVLSINGVGTKWMSWTQLASIVICLPFLMVFKEKYGRLNVDSMEISLQNIKQ
ncbi:DgyrCDS8910 [Dimorphilus gyrociliatus]|uniref:DgyrCDS8910 n=1 Tax=Dimorphilus gyrociliatus TaxID=2664684 RepID=A0A7I8VX86_9ANNE|nr:DgyrCDS8910 [Dimorphilus gyrociliatus]